MGNHATGPGPLTDDGCAVELYRRLVATGEPELVETEVRAGSTILELGAGAGRVTHPLLRKGYRVTAVDSSADMLAQIWGAETILAQIETLALGRTFDAVVLGSNLINTPDDRQRTALLNTCRRHVAENGIVLIESYAPSRIKALHDGMLEDRDGVRCSLQDFKLSVNEFSATIVYEAVDATWTQSFTAKIFDEDDVTHELRKSGLAFRRWLDDRKTWLSATRPSAH